MIVIENVLWKVSEIRNVFMPVKEKMQISLIRKIYFQQKNRGLEEFWKDLKGYKRTTLLEDEGRLEFRTENKATLRIVSQLMMNFDRQITHHNMIVLIWCTQSDLPSTHNVHWNYSCRSEKSRGEPPYLRIFTNSICMPT